MSTSKVPSKNKPLKPAVAAAVLEHLELKPLIRLLHSPPETPDHLEKANEIEEFEVFFRALFKVEHIMKELGPLDVYVTRLGYLFGIHAHLLSTLDYSESDGTKEKIRELQHKKRQKMAAVQGLEREKDAFDSLVYRDGHNFYFTKEQLEETITSVGFYKTLQRARDEIFEQGKVANELNAKYIRLAPETKHVAFATWTVAFYKVFLMYAKEDWSHYSFVMGDKAAKGDGKGPTHDEVVQAHNYYKECIRPIQISDNIPLDELEKTEINFDNYSSGSGSNE